MTEPRNPLTKATHRGGVDVMDHEPPTRPYLHVGDQQADAARRAVTRTGNRAGWTADIPLILDMLGIPQPEGKP